MGKVMGALVGAFSLGAISMTALTGVLGPVAECAALGVMGLSLLGASAIFRAPAAAPVGRQAEA